MRAEGGRINAERLSFHPLFVGAIIKYTLYVGGNLYAV